MKNNPNNMNSNKSIKLDFGGFSTVHVIAQRTEHDAMSTKYFKLHRLLLLDFGLYSHRA